MDERQRSHGRTNWGAVLVVLALGAHGCSGVIGDPAADPASEVTEPGAATAASECEAAIPSVGAAPLRRLTHAEYENTIVDVFGISALPAEARSRLRTIAEGRAGGYASTTTALMDIELEQYLTIATDTASVIGHERIAAFAPCDPADAACSAPLVHALVRRLFRRPVVDDDELGRWVALLDEQRTELGTESALETLVTGMLSSASFLYREERVRTEDAHDGLLPLDDHSIANRLSYTLWQSAPDEALLAAADAGELRTPERLREEALRMLDDPRSDRGVASFHTQWLEISDLASMERAEPEWSRELGAAMVREVELLVTALTRDPTGSVSTLLTADFAYVDPSLASFYEVAPPESALERTELPGDRAGVLTSLAVLARFGEGHAEIFRGKFVRDTFLCDAPLPPGGDIVLDPTIDRLATAPCVECHRHIDPIGYGFADFDSLGRLTPESAGSRASHGPPHVTTIGPESALVAGEFADPVELGERLATTGAAESCFTKHFYRYAMGRSEQAADRCAIDGVRETFAASGGNIRELIVAIAMSDAFRSRSARDFE